MNRSIFLALGVLMMLPAVSCRKHADFPDEDLVDYNVKTRWFSVKNCTFVEDPAAKFDLDGDGKSGLFYDEIMGLTNLKQHNWKTEMFMSCVDEFYTEGRFSDGQWSAVLPIQSMLGDYNREKDEIDPAFPMPRQLPFFGGTLPMSGKIDKEHNFEKWILSGKNGQIEYEYYQGQPAQGKDDGDWSVTIDAIFYDFVRQNFVRGTLLYTFDLFKVEYDGVER